MEKLDNFLKDFNFAQTAEEKQTLLDEFVSVAEISNDELKELKLQIDDIKESNAIEQDITISLQIEDGIYQLYTCQKTLTILEQTYSSGSNYYVKVDDPKEFYLSTGIGETNSLIKDMIDSIKPTYFIVTDDGIGTLKRKNIFSKDIDFSDYFTKFA